jgi:hypothetical protein
MDEFGIGHLIPIRLKFLFSRKSSRERRVWGIIPTGAGLREAK